MAQDYSQEKELARRLYIYTNLTASYIAKRVGISNKSMSKWIKQGCWKEERSKQKQLSSTFSDTTYSQTVIVMDEFKLYLKKILPDVSPLICDYINRFLLQKLSI